MYVLFGSGQCGDSCLDCVGDENVAYFLDNDESKKGSKRGISVYSFQEKVDDLRNGDYQIILSVSDRYEEELAKQLTEYGITDFIAFSTYKYNIIREKIARRMDYIGVYKKAMEWVKQHTVSQVGVVNYDMETPYPEVTGYFIPSLLYWGERELAVSYAKWLCDIQKEDGSWYDTYDKIPYVFDTAQILKGLIAVRDICPDVDENILRGCDWLLNRVDDDGRLPAVVDDWGDGKTYSELIHLYCLSPLVDAARIFKKSEYKMTAYRVLNYYIRNYKDRILHFHLLTHFYAYVMEGLLDMGQVDLVQQAMDDVAKYQKEDGSVPGYNNVNWICSTGLFQLALVWFRLGNLKRGNQAFEYACKLQNESGGWFGSYYHPDFPKDHPKYIAQREISWAVKYFLDALRYKAVSSFEAWDPGAYFDFISKEDPKYLVIKNAAVGMERPLRICEVGCYHGRYLRNLLEEFPDWHYYGVDISNITLQALKDLPIKTKQGALTCIPYPDESFDCVYGCESLEHAVDIENAVREMARVTKRGGVIIIIDKIVEKLGIYEIEDWEQWFDEEELAQLMKKYCSDVQIIHDAGKDSGSRKNIFSAWIGVVG